MADLLILSLVVWLPVLLHGISKRGFVLILAWLLVAPIALYALDSVGRTPSVEAGASDATRKGGYLASETNIRARELLDPTRLLFSGFLLVFLIEAAVKRKRLGRFDTTEKFAFFFSVILIASAFLQSNRVAFSLRIASDAFIIPLVAYFCSRRLVTSEERLRKITQVVMYVGLYLIIIGLVERLTLTHLYSRVNGPFWSRNELYIVMLVVFFVAWVESLRTGPTRTSRMSLPALMQRFVLCLAPVIILFGWGRGNLVGLLSGIWTFMFLGRRLVHSSRIIGTVGLLLLVPTIGIGLYEIIPEQVVEERISRPATVYARLGAWQIIKDEIARSPIVGIGFNNLRDVLYEKRIVYDGVKSETLAHNSFLAMVAELGVIGLLAYLAIGLSIIRMGLMLYRTGVTLQERWRGVALIAIVIAYWVAALFDGSLYRPSVSHIYLYVVAGGIAGLHGRRRSPPALSASMAGNRSIVANVPAGAQLR